MRIYKTPKTVTDDELTQLIDAQYFLQRRSTTKDVSTTTFVDAICGKKYRRASWTLFIMNTINQWTGISGITMYCNRMLVSINEQTDGAFPVSALVGTYIVGALQACGAIFGILLLVLMGRKTILILGQLTMGFSAVMLATCLLKEWYLPSFVFINLYVFCFQFS